MEPAVQRNQVHARRRHDFGQRVVVDGSAKLVVKDDGQCIDPDFLPRIFDMFGQAPGRALHGRAGLGIGLSLVRQLVTRHGGRVTASSSGIGKGATFIVSLPVFELMERSTQKSLGHDTGPRLAGLKLLVVEDAQDAAMAMAKLLEMEGASVAVAGDGCEALQRLDEAPFDMVLSDIGMPDMDGYELVAAIRKSGRFAELPVVALTGFGRESDADRATDAGFNAHLSKPVAIDELIELFRKLRAPTTDA